MKSHMLSFTEAEIVHLLELLYKNEDSSEYYRSPIPYKSRHKRIIDKLEGAFRCTKA